MLAKPDEGVGIRCESDMLEYNMWHHHPSEVDIEPLQALTRVWLGWGAGRDEEASLHGRHMDMSLTTCSNLVMH